MWSSDLCMHIATTKVKGEVMVRTIAHLKDMHNKKLKGKCKPACESKPKLRV